MARALRPRVLVLTAPVDPTADMVLTHLHSDGVPFLRLEPYELPNAVVTGALRLMRSLSLVFGALDFVLTEQGHQFIEINPNGQWGWIEHQTGQPISRTIAAALRGTQA